MVGMSKILKNRRGSLTAEAAIAVPFFICVIVSIAFLMRILYIQSVMQHAISETANELSNYSYLYSVTLQDYQDQAKGLLNEGKEPFNKHLDDAVNAYSTLSEVKSSAIDTVNQAKDAVSSGDTQQINDILTSIKEGKINNDIQKVQEGTQKLKTIFTDIKSSPKKELLSVISVLADGSFEDMKAYVAEPIIRTLIQKYIEKDGLSADQRLKKLFVVDGFKGIDFSQSTIFKDNKTIEIVVRYNIASVVPIKVMPDIYIIQRASVRAWLDGDASEKDESAKDESNIWDLSWKDRGNAIQKLEGRNMPSNYPVISKCDTNGNTTKIMSIDMEESATYKIPKKLESHIKSTINEYTKVNEVKYEGKKMNIKSKTLVIVIPEIELDKETEAVFEKCIKYAKENNIKLIKKPAYGKRSKTNESGTEDKTDAMT